MFLISYVKWDILSPRIRIFHRFWIRIRIQLGTMNGDPQPCIVSWCSWSTNLSNIFIRYHVNCQLVPYTSGRMSRVPGIVPFMIFRHSFYLNSFLLCRLECKYHRLYEPLYNKRAQITAGNFSFQGVTKNDADKRCYGSHKESTRT